MRNVLVRFEVSVSKDKIICVASPDYVFELEYDKDSDDLSSICSLEFNVENLARSFKSLGYNVVVIRRESVYLNFD